MKIQVAGENALILYFGDAVSDDVSQSIQDVASGLSRYVGSVLIDMVPSYASLMVIFNPLLTDHLKVRQLIREALKNTSQEQADAQGSVITLPAYYGLDAAPDLENLAENAGLSCQQVIDIHTAMEYRVYAIGFAPGFAYLGEVDARIAAPRLATPRKKVPKGAVAIADRQTAVYPAVSPGGWNLIGLCPVDMFNPNVKPTMPVQVGDRVQFKSIEREEFLSLGGAL
ncbi:allophanate hydrolase [Bermanella sp. 47_1433_sub80_T6]|nr:allophanate hydrolase [Bermanella sp. 47_1433_sub80_T6]